MKFFRGIIQSAQDIGSGLRTVTALGRGVREINNRPIMGQRGLVSVPKSGDSVLFLQSDELIVAIATESQDRPKADNGDTILYSTADYFIRLDAEGNVLVNAKKIILGSDRVTQSPMTGCVTGECLCAFTGAPHPDVSKVVLAQKEAL